MKNIAAILVLLFGWLPLLVMLANGFWWILSGSVIVPMSADQICFGVIWTITVGIFSVFIAGSLMEDF